ncbi:GntR family transcriptional regulator [Rhodobacterales bacterium HKCCE2091]|nr:GntR family transcriptional regulator [Rhodobacterales bacterium HKCCE2091]
MGYDRNRPAAEGVAKPTRVSRIAAELSAAIIAGDLPPGTKLNLEHLRRRFGVSLSPLREALSRLVPKGLVASEDQRGYSVTPVSAGNLAEITDLLAQSEALALSRAMSAASLDWESEVLAALHRAQRAEDPADLARYDRLHAALAAAPGMPVLSRQIGTLRDHFLRYRRLTGYTGAERDLSAEYTQIASAAVSRNAELAPLLLRQQVERSGRGIAAAFGAVGAEP